MDQVFNAKWSVRMRTLPAPAITRLHGKFYRKITVLRDDARPNRDRDFSDSEEGTIEACSLDSIDIRLVQEILLLKGPEEEHPPYSASRTSSSFNINVNRRAVHTRFKPSSTRAWFPCACIARRPCDEFTSSMSQPN